MLPDVPTLTESGPQGADIYEWNALFAPSGTPEQVVQKLNAALHKAIDAPDVKARIAQLGGEPQRTTPDAAQQFISAQMSLWARVIKDRNITIE
jgi:tripartite-type tricarboxylate transporter receptor subunit TctC